MITPIQGPNFLGYNSILKDLFKQDKLPSVKKGFYGDELTKENASLEHLKPHSKGGPTILSNLVLASKKNNSNRGNEPFLKFFNPKTAKEYLNQFTDVIVKYTKGGIERIFDGNKYKKQITRTVNELGGNLDLKG